MRGGISGMNNNPIDYTEVSPVGQQQQRIERRTLRHQQYYKHAAGFTGAITGVQGGVSGTYTTTGVDF
jgi:hypothetical protein